MSFPQQQPLPLQQQDTAVQEERRPKHDADADRDEEDPLVSVGGGSGVGSGVGGGTTKRKFSRASPRSRGTAATAAGENSRAAASSSADAAAAAAAGSGILYRRLLKEDKEDDDNTNDDDGGSDHRRDGGGDDDNNANNTDDSSGINVVADDTTTTSPPLLRRILYSNLFPDDCYTVRVNGGEGSSQRGVVHILDGPEAVKLLKFIAATYLLLVLVYRFIRWMDWEHDRSMTVLDTWTYESPAICLDCVAFFVVGRLYQQPGIDYGAWIATVLAANVYNSYLPTFAFLRHSATLYEMHCTWPWQLWVYVLVLIPVLGAVVALHVRKAVRDRTLVVKLTEITVTAVMLVSPYASSRYFHAHHWFVGWFVGMHCNCSTAWWSVTAQAWCWGMYVNGVAAWGRDPVLMCGYAYYLSATATTPACPYMDCYLDAMNRTPSPSGGPTLPPVHELVPPEWWNCSADSYHP